MDARTEYWVTLARGDSLLSIVRDTDGHPIQGARVMLSRVHLPGPKEALAFSDDAREYQPCGDSETCIFSARTDENGLAVLDGLPQGQCFVSVLKRGYIRSTMTPYPARIPCGPVQVEMRRLYAAAWAVAGDRIVDSLVEPPRGTQHLVAGLLDHVAEETRRRIDADGCPVFVKKARVAEPEFLRRAVTVRCLLERCGYVSFEVPMRVLDSVDAPYVEDCTTRADRAGEDVVVTIRSRGGGVAPPGARLPFTLAPTKQGAGFGTDLVSGQSLRLPWGEYEVHATGPLPLLHKPILLQVGPGSREFEVLLDGDMVPVILTLRDERGRMLPYGAYSVRYDDLPVGFSGFISEGRAGETRMWPKGRARITLQCDDLVADGIACNIERSGSGDCAIDAVLRPR